MNQKLFAWSAQLDFICSTDHALLLVPMDSTETMTSSYAMVWPDIFDSPLQNAMLPALPVMDHPMITACRATTQPT